MYDLSNAKFEIPRGSLANPDERSFVDEVLHSAVYSAAQTPLKGLSEIADQVTGSKLSANVDFMDAPTQANSGSAKWLAQQAGGAIGTVVPFLLTNAGVGRVFKGLQPVVGETANLAMQREVTRAAVSGFAFDSLLKPNEQKSANWQDFATQRLESGVVGAATFASLTASTQGLARFADSGLLKQSEFGKSTVAPLLKNSIATGLLSGVPAGLVSAEGTSYAREGRAATFDEIASAATSMSLVGGLFGIGHRFTNRNVEAKPGGAKPAPETREPEGQGREAQAPEAQEPQIQAPEKPRGPELRLSEPELAPPQTFNFSQFPGDNAVTPIEPGKAAFVTAEAKVIPANGAIVFADAEARVPEAKGAIVLKNPENEFLAKEAHDLDWHQEKIPSTADGAKVVSNESIVATAGAPVVAEAGTIVRATEGSQVYAKAGSQIIAEKGSLVRAYYGAEVVAGEGSVVKAFEGSKVVAQEGSEVKANMYSRVIAEANSHVTALSESEVIALNGSKIQAKDSAVIHAMNGSEVIAEQNAQVHVYGEARVEAKNGSVIKVHDGAHFEAGAKYTTVAEAGSIVRATDGATVYATAGSTVLAENGSKTYAAQGSEVFAKDGSYVYTQPYSKVFAFDGSTVYATELSSTYAQAGSKVHAERNATVYGGNGSEIFAGPGSKIIADNGSIVHAHALAEVRRLGNNATVTDLTEEFIRNPVARNLSIADEVKWMQRLSIENRSQVRLFMQDLWFRHGLDSGSNFKAPENIESKASRPSLLERKPWHTVSHIRDAFRFKTVLDDIESLPKIVEELNKRNGWQIVKVDVDKVLTPGEWGWRIIAFDLRMPNGQLVEYYLPMKELEAAKKEKNHHLFEKWRNKKLGELTADELAERAADLAESRERYNNAWQEGLRRSGRTEEDVQRVLDKVKAMDPNQPRI